MVWPSSAQGIRPYEREVYPNHIGVSLSRLSPPPLFSNHNSPALLPRASRALQKTQQRRRATNSCICHRSEKCARNSFSCHTSKNTGLKVLHLPHIQKMAGVGVLLLTRPSVLSFVPILTSCLGASVAIPLRAGAAVVVKFLSLGTKES